MNRWLLYAFALALFAGSLVITIKLMFPEW
jgi:hypothetical protein